MINSRGKTQQIDDFYGYLKRDNGLKALNFNKEEYFQGLFDFPFDQKLRNAIGHNNYKYDGITQQIMLIQKNNSADSGISISLTEVALVCFGFIRSATALSEMLLLLMRRKYFGNGVRSLMPVHLYPNGFKGPNKKCPCGSGGKFKKCCLEDLRAIK